MSFANERVNILVVESNEPLRKGFETMITDLNIARQVYCARTGEEAVQVAPHFKTDAVVMNYALADMLAKDCIKQIKKQVPGAAVICIVPKLRPAEVVSLMSYGCNGFLNITFTSAALQKAFDATLQGQHFFAEEIANLVAAHTFKKLAKANAAPGYDISNKEKQVLCYIYFDELTNKQIADKMGTTPKGVEAVRNQLFKKMEVKNVAGVVKQALRKGIIVDPEI